MNTRAFWVDSAYQIVTWVVIAICVGGIFYCKGRDCRKGVIAWGIGLFFAIVLMLALLAYQFRHKTVVKPEQQSVFVKSAQMEPLVPGKPPVAKIAIQNGRGETTLVFSNVSFVLTYLVPEKYLKYQASPTQTFVFGDHQANMSEWTGNQVNLSQDDINALNADPPAAELYVFGKGEYSTDAGKRRLNVCRKYYKPSAPELSFCADDIKIE